MGKTMGDYSLAIRQRNVIQNIVLNMLDKYRPLPRVGQAVLIDRIGLKAEVAFPGSEVTLLAKFSRGNQPRDVGSIVVVEGRPGDYRITACMDEAFSEFMVPVGGIVIDANPSATAPTGYLLCDGSFVEQETYARLFAKIGHTYAADPGNGTFKLPTLANPGTNLRYVIKT